MVSKKNKVSTPEKILKQSSLRQFFKTATPSPVRMPPLARRSMFDEKEKAPPPSPIVFKIDDVVDEKPKPHEVLFVNQEDDDHHQVHLTFQKKTRCNTQSTSGRKVRNRGFYVGSNEAPQELLPEASQPREWKQVSG